MRPIHQSVTTTQRIRLVSVNINNERSPPPLVLQKGPPLKSVSPSIIQSSTYFHSRSSTRLYNHHHEVIINGPLDLLLSTPEFWSAAIMLTIVGLLLAWEESVLTLREKLPTALLSVVDSMLAEMGGLGFIGLFLAVVVTDGPLGDIIGELSERFLGEEEILLETFEFLHQAFFEVGIGFFTIAGVTVYAVLKEIQKLSEISELALDTDGDGEVSLEELADALDVQSLIVDADGDGEITEEEVTDALRRSQRIGILDEISMTPEEMCSEALVIRERIILERGLPESFLIEKYFEQIFAHNLEEIVELSPVTWLPLIPFVDLVNSVDLEHDVVSAASANAFSTCGDFISTPWVFYPTVLLQVLCLAWGLYNFWKMAAIKGMLMPTLVRDGSGDGPAVLLPPRVEDKQIRRDFQSTPAFARFVEEPLGKPATNSHEQLFGSAGANGPKLFLKSIKFHTWLCVAQIVFYGTEIVFRDLAALSGGNKELVGNPDALIPEAFVFGFFVLLSVAQLSLAPRTFLNYSFATSIEDMTKGWAMKIAMQESEAIAAKEAELTELAAAGE